MCARQTGGDVVLVTVRWYSALVMVAERLAAGHALFLYSKADMWAVREHITSVTTDLLDLQQHWSQTAAGLPDGTSQDSTPSCCFAVRTASPEASLQQSIHFRPSPGFIKDHTFVCSKSRQLLPEVW